MENKLKMTSVSLNPYEVSYNKLKNTPLFNQTEWEQMLSRGQLDLDNYISVISQYDKLPDYESMVSEKNIDRMDLDTKMLYYYNKLGYFDDKDVKSWDITTGYDEQGKEIKEKFEGTEKQYYDRLLNDWQLYDQAKLKAERIQYERDNMGFFEKLYNTVVGVLAEGGRGIIDGIANFANLVESIVISAGDFFVGDWSDIGKDFRQSMSTSIWKDIGGEELESWYNDDFVGEHIRWMQNNPWLYKDDGSQTFVGQMLAGSMYSIGQMIPGLLAGAGINMAMSTTPTIAGGASLFGTLGGATKAGISAATASRIAQQTVYYGSMWSSQVHEDFNNPELASLSTLSILTKDTAIVAADYAIEQISGHLLGGTVMDRLALGISGGKGSFLSNYVFGSLVEGAEEVLQETSQWAINALMSLGEGCDAFYTNLTGEQIALAFTSAALSNFITGGFSDAVNLVVKNAQYNDIFKHDETYNAIKNSINDKTARKQILKKYRKGMTGIMEAYADIMSDIDTSKTSGRKLANQLTEQMYGSFNTLMNIYGAMGEKASAQAETIVAKIQSDLENKNATDKAVKIFARDIYTAAEIIKATAPVSLSQKDKIKKATEKAKNDGKLSSDEKSEVRAKILGAFSQDADTVDTVDSSIKVKENGIKNARDLAKAGYEVIVTADTSYIVESDGVLYVPLAELENLTDAQILKSAAERNVVQYLINKMPNDILAKLGKIYKDTTGKSATHVRLVYELLFNESFYRIALAYSDIDMYSIFSSLDNIYVELVTNKGKTALNTDELATANKIRKTMGASIVMYLCNNPDADLQGLTVLTEAQKKFVLDHRYNYILFTKLLNKTDVTESEYTAIQNRINSLPMSKTAKDTLLTKIKSDDKRQRLSALNELDDRYNAIFKGPYNDKIYMSGNDVKSCMFNEFARLEGIDLRDLRVYNHANPTLREKVIKAKGTYSRANKLAYIKERFELFTSNVYTVDVTETTTRTAVSTAISSRPVSKKLKLDYTYDNKQIALLKPMLDTLYKMYYDETGVLKSVSELDQSSIIVNNEIYNTESILKIHGKRMTEPYGPKNKLLAVIQTNFYNEVIKPKWDAVAKDVIKTYKDKDAKEYRRKSAFELWYSDYVKSNLQYIQNEANRIRTEVLAEIKRRKLDIDERQETPAEDVTVETPIEKVVEPEKTTQETPKKVEVKEPKKVDVKEPKKVDYSTNRVIDVFITEKSDDTYVPPSMVPASRTNITTSDNKDSLYPVFVSDTTANLTNLLLDDTVDDFDKSYISIADIINSPNKFLSKKLKDQILENEGTINKVTAYRYLNNYFAELSDGKIGLNVDANGNAYFVTYEHIDYFLKSNILNERKDTTTLFDRYKGSDVSIADFVPNSFLSGILADVKVSVKQVSVDNVRLEYSLNDNTIYIHYNKPLSNAVFRYTIVHEFNHAIQMANNLAEGFDTDYTITDDLVNDIFKHVPELENNMKTSKLNVKAYLKEKREIAKDFIYYAALGEMVSYGRSYMNYNMYPVIVKTKGLGTEVTLPWGTKFTINADNKTVISKKIKLQGESGTDYELVSETEYPKYISEGLVDTIIKDSEEYNAVINDYNDAYNYLDMDEWVKRGKIHDEHTTNIDQKKLVFNKITDPKNERKIDALFKGFWAANFRHLTYEEFLNADMPISRIQFGEKIVDDKTFVSVSLTDNPNIMAFRWDPFNTDFNNRDLYVFTGTIKPKQLLAVFSNVQMECLLPTSIANSTFTAMKKINIIDGIAYVEDNDTFNNIVLDNYSRLQLSKRFVRASEKYAIDAFNYQGTKYTIIPLQAGHSAGNFFTNYANVYFKSKKDIVKAINATKESLLKTDDLIDAKLIDKYYDDGFIICEYNKRGAILYVNDLESVENPLSENIKNSIIRESKLYKPLKIVNKRTGKLLQSYNFGFDMKLLFERAYKKRYYLDFRRKEAKLDSSDSKWETVTKEQYKEALEYIERVNKWINLAKQTKKPEEALKKAGASEQFINELLEGKYYKGKDATYQKYLRIKHAYERKEQRETTRKELSDRRKAKGLTYQYVTLFKKNTAGTNLQYYTDKDTDYPPRLTLAMQNFVLSIDLDKIDPIIANGIRSGDWTQDDVFDYIRRAKTIDDYTFNELTKAFFPETPFKTFKELDNFLNFDLADFYALSGALKEEGWDDLLFEKLPKDYKSFIEKIRTNPSIAKKMDKIKERFEIKGYHKDANGVVHGEQLSIDYEQARLGALRRFDGTISTAASVAGIAKFIAYKGWNARSSKRTLDLDKPLDDSATGTLGDIIGTDEEATSHITLDTKRNALKENAYNILYKLVRLLQSKNIRDKQADIKNVSKSLAQTLSFKFNDMSLNEQQTFITKNILRRIYNPKERTVLKEGVVKLTEKISNFFEGLSESEVSLLYSLQNISSEVGLDEEIVTLSESIKRVKRKSIYDKLSQAIGTNDQYMNVSIYKNLPDDMKKYFDEKTFKFKRDEYLKGKHNDAIKLTKLYEKLRPLFTAIRSHHYDSKTTAKLAKDVETWKKRYLKEKAKNLVATPTEVKEVNNVKLATNTTFKLKSNISIPPVLLDILNTTFDDAYKTSVKFLSSSDQYHMRISAEDFFDKNAEKLDSLTVDDINAILTYFEQSMFDGELSSDEFVKYEGLKVMLVAFWIGQIEIGAIDADENLMNRLKQWEQSKVSSAATVLSTWRAVLKRVKPEQIIAKKLFLSYDIEVKEEELKPLSNAVAKGDIELIREERKKLYDILIKRYRLSNKGAKGIINKLLKIQKASMLSGPSTVVRSHVSNFIITGLNEASDFVGNLFTKKKEYVKGQYDLRGIKVSEDVAHWIKDNVIDNQLYDMISDGLTRYDGRRLQTVKDKNKPEVFSQQITELIARSVMTDIFHNQTFESETANKVLNFVFKLQNDDPYIKKTFIRYLGKIIAHDNIDLTKGYNDKVMNAVAVAYSMVSYDFVHRTNIISKLENQLYNKNKAAYVGYKLIMPFASAGYNWFIEALQYNPIALGVNIFNLINIENKISKLEEARRTGDMSNYDPRFAEMLARRNIGKGAIGTVGLVLGMILGALGIISVDRDDEKLKLNIGNTYIDISNVFGSSMFLLGAQFVQPTDEGDWWTVLESAFNLTFEDFILTDLINLFRNKNTLSDFVTELPMNLINGFIPNLWKSIVKAVNTKKISYSKGFLGDLEYFVYSNVPGSASWFNAKVDVYTGEDEVRYLSKWYVNWLNSILPFSIKEYDISDVEMAFIEANISKEMLKGEYKDLGQLDVEMLNKKYGELNNKIVTDFINDKVAYEVELTNGKRVKLKYSKMSIEQRKSVLERITNQNAEYAKIYTWTQSGHKYYCSRDKRVTLSKLGITKNVYVGNKGFVK